MASEHNPERKEVGRSFDGSAKLTIGIVSGLLMLIVGIVLIVYAGTIGLVLGIPFVLLGLILPIFLQFGLAGKRE